MNCFVNKYSGIDVDWFGVDKNGLIIHFSSGGANIAQTSICNSLDYNTVRTYFYSLSLFYSKGDINKEVLKELGFNNRSEKERYLEGYIDMSCRGLYSFDKDHMDYSGRFYNLISYPTKPITIQDVPANIQVILNKTQFAFDVTLINEIIVLDDSLGYVFDRADNKCDSLDNVSLEWILK